MQRIWKYAIARDAKAIFDIPNGAEVVQVAMQDGGLCFWAIVNDNDSSERRVFSFIGTGHPIPSFTKYVGTAFDGPFVWHLFEHQV